MFGFNWYFGTTRRYIIYFGTVMNQIYIDRINPDGTVNNTIRVPITYGPREKVLSRVQQDPNLDRPFESVLPYMSFQIVDMYYDEDRHLVPTGRIARQTSNKDVASFVYNPVPYNYEFELVIMVKNLEDGYRIVEQILPFFTPEYTATLRLIDDPVIEKDIPLVIKDHGFSYKDNWDSGMDQRRYVTFTLNFVMKGYLFGPVQKHKLIKFSDTRAFTTEGYLGSTIHVSPGLDANGMPTSDPNNTVPYSDITWTDDYGIITTIEN